MKYFTGLPCGYNHVSQRYVCSYSCVECVLEVSKSDEYKKYMKGWIKNNPDKTLEHARKSRINNRDAKITRDRKYRKENWDICYRAQKEWVKNNPDSIKKISRAWRLRHPEIVTIKGKVEAQRRRRAEGVFTAEDILLLLKNQGGLCAEKTCRQKISINPVHGERKAHLDHKVPISRGGTNWPENLQYLCAHCNCSKSDMLPHEWNAHRSAM